MYQVYKYTHHWIEDKKAERKEQQDYFSKQWEKRNGLLDYEAGRIPNELKVKASTQNTLRIKLSKVRQRMLIPKREK